MWLSGKDFTSVAELSLAEMSPLSAALQRLVLISSVIPESAQIKVSLLTPLLFFGLQAGNIIGGRRVGLKNIFCTERRVVTEEKQWNSFQTIKQWFSVDPEEEIILKLKVFYICFHVRQKVNSDEILQTFLTNIFIGILSFRYIKTYTVYSSKHLHPTLSSPSPFVNNL